MESVHGELLVKESEAGPAADLDRISLEQALRDFDVANARVVDLTHRLTTLSRQLAESKAQNAKLRQRIRKLQQTQTTAAAPRVPVPPSIPRRVVRKLRRVRAGLRR